MCADRSRRTKIPSGLRRALAEGFRLETDLRRDLGGEFYIAHDPHPRTAANDLAAYAQLFRQWPDRVIAMNVKELGYAEALIALHADGALGDRAFTSTSNSSNRRPPATRRDGCAACPAAPELRSRRGSVTVAKRSRNV